MKTKVFLLRRTGDIYKMGDEAVHYSGVPFQGPDKDNIDLARTFKSPAAARRANEFKHDGYEVVEATVTITITE